jgi:Ca-activated chloride channel family protein
MKVITPWFVQPSGLYLLGMVPALVVTAIFGWRWRRRALNRLGSRFAVSTLSSVRRGRRLLGTIALLAGVCSLILGVAGPQWGPDLDLATAPGRDVVVVLDMSRSMLAEDVLGRSARNRFGRARDALRDLADAMERRGGHRLALVTFAARARVACPLTHDYDHFRETLDQLDPGDPIWDIGPTAESTSGTRIGAALAEAVRIHEPRNHGLQDILLLSDGDDPVPDEEWRQGAALAAKHHIPVYAFGIGDPDQGSPIYRHGSDRLRHDGHEVVTRLEERPLQEIARLTGGTYVPARTRALPLGKLFQEYIEPLAAYEDSEDPLPVYQRRYPWFFGSALIVFALGMALGDGRRR